MANAMRETGEVARDRDLLTSCSALAAEAQDREDEGSVYLQEMAFSRTGIRAVTTSSWVMERVVGSTRILGCSMLFFFKRTVLDKAKPPNQDVKCTRHTYSMPGGINLSGTRTLGLFGWPRLILA